MIRPLVVALVVAATVVPLSSAARIDRVQRLIDALADRDYRVRMQAALMLAKLKDRRAVPGLVRSLSDNHPLVRGVVAHTLGLLGDSRALPPLRERLSDSDDLVRRKAKDAIDQLRRPAYAGLRHAVFVRLAGVGDRTKRGGALVPKLRRLWTERIEQSPGLRLTLQRTVPKGQKIYEVTSAITELWSRRQGTYMETTCSISLVLGDHKGSIVMMTSGGATVQVQSRSQNETAQQTSALEGAISSAHANLMRFLASR
jgi:hypothetical protein